MSTIVFHRPPRRDGPALPAEEIVLQEPPELPAPRKQNLLYMLYMLPMMLGFSLSGLTAFRPGGGGSLLSLLGPGMMGLSMVGMGFMWMGRSNQGTDLTTDRRDYLRYLSMIRQRLRDLSDQQRRAVRWRHPDPVQLDGLIDDDRLWERRVHDPDFCQVRIGVGPQRLAVTLTPPLTRPVEDLEPLAAISLRRFIEAGRTIGELPVSAALPRFSKILLRGEGDTMDGMVRSLLCQLAALHSPADVRIVVCASPERQEVWSWLKWLPHCQHPTDLDRAGRSRLFYESIEQVEALLGLAGSGEPPPFDPDTVPVDGDVTTLLVLDDVAVPVGSRLATSGVAGTTVLDVSGTFVPVDTNGVLSLEVAADHLRRHLDDGAVDLGRPDTMTVTESTGLARRLARYRAPTSVGADVDAPLSRNRDLAELLGVGDVIGFDPSTTQQLFVTGGHLEARIGVLPNGTPLVLNLREGAQGGSGPHGMLVGATGSGKSELLRTLVLSLAASHSPTILNFVLVDFKGGATFLGCEELPHTSALITNLADELTLVDRMQDAVKGELIRRQEVLRAAGYASVTDYERARAAGADLEPIPSLLLIVDEFSELLRVKREFSELFIMIGRLGRSLSVHLLLATQRLDEGRIHELLSHLSYRIGLKMFSSGESRSVLGTTAAYEDELTPGNGYLRIDGRLERFKAAYVSAPVAPRRPAETSAAAAEASPDDLVVPFGHTYLPPDDEATDPSQATDPTTSEGSGDSEEYDRDTPTVYTALIDRLATTGLAARRIWLPPLADPPPLSALLPPSSVTDTAGFGCGPSPFGQLRTPVAIIDNPFEQRYDVLIGDVGGAGGHVTVAGAPKSGKSTLLTTFLLGLSLTNTPRQVQFYCLDFGGGSLANLRGLPHLGDLATRKDRERVDRTVTEILDLLDQRETRFEAAGVSSIEEFRHRRAAGEFSDDPYADDVFLVIDGWGTFHSDFVEVEARLPRVVSSGLAYGIHVVAASNRWSEMRPWLRDNAGTRFELRMGDRIDSLVDSRAAATVPQIPGRGLAEGARHFLTALPRLDGSSATGDLAEAVRRLVAVVAANWRGPSAPRVQQLPGSLSVRDLPPPGGGGSRASDLRLPLGLGGDDLEPVWIDFGEHPHLLVVGDSGSGKTNALAVVAEAVATSVPPDVGQVVLADYRRKLHPVVPEAQRLAFAVSGPALRGMASDLAVTLRQRIPDSGVSLDQLAERGWWQGKQLFVLVDDYDLLSSGSDSPLQPFSDLLGSGAEIGFHLVIARAAAGVGRGGLEPVWRRLLELNTPLLLLSCPREEGAINGVRPERLPPGRARLIRGRHAPLIQVALADSSDPGVAG